MKGGHGLLAASSTSTGSEGLAQICPSHRCRGSEVSLGIHKHVASCEAKGWRARPSLAKGITLKNHDLGFIRVFCTAEDEPSTCSSLHGCLPSTFQAGFVQLHLHVPVSRAGSTEHECFCIWACMQTATGKFICIELGSVHCQDQTTVITPMILPIPFYLRFWESHCEAIRYSVRSDQYCRWQIG